MSKVPRLRRLAQAQGSPGGVVAGDARETTHGSVVGPSCVFHPDWSVLLPGTALWALALYIPLSAPLTRLERVLAEGPLSDGQQQVVLIVSSLLLALGVGAVTNGGIGWALGPGWGTSLGLMAALAGLFWGLTDRQNPPKP